MPCGPQALCAALAQQATVRTYWYWQLPRGAIQWSVGWLSGQRPPLASMLYMRSSLGHVMRSCPRLPLCQHLSLAVRAVAQTGAQAGAGAGARPETRPTEQQAKPEEKPKEKKEENRVEVELEVAATQPISGVAVAVDTGKEKEPTEKEVQGEVEKYGKKEYGPLRARFCKKHPYHPLC